ncbi:MAG TPA: thioredoxin domain-containing protein [Myxococcaceae bacterium]|nr:thioredoxin domain-containing protein [Myxococcaceae bacterium]
MGAVIIGTVKRATCVVGLLLLAIVPVLGCKDRAQVPVPKHTERTWVPLSPVPLRGPATAKVTLVIFCDFQSPYCGRAAEQLLEVRREYGDSLRIQYRHNPLPIYPHSQLAAEASAAAAEQGQFWRYHDILFARQDALDRASLERYAQELGLDIERFREALTSERARQRVDADSILAAQLQARGAPVLFVNGRPIRGVVALRELKQLLDEEIAEADRLVDSGVAPQELYLRLARVPAMGQPPKQPLVLQATPDAPRADRALSQGGPTQETLHKVDVSGAPFKGPQDAKVTIVLWSDFECAGCGVFGSMVDSVASAYSKDVRVVWKFRPVPDHPGAMLASEAALAAGAEGKFWQMHDLLFARPVFERAALEAYAKKLELDMIRFRAALDERKYAEQVSSDLELSERLAIRNLPTLFINGKRLDLVEERTRAGVAPSPEVIRAWIEKAIQDAEQLLKQGVPSSKLYESLTAHGQEAVEPRLSDLPPLPRGVYQVDVGDSPVRGPNDAPITIVTFSDFQCPYCARLEKTLAQVRAHYGNQVRIVWKDAPNVELHGEAMQAHEAARAAHEQGRFWEMHDRIFKRPYVLNRTMFERYAAELGMDTDRFRRALDEGKFKAAIREETAYGVSLAGPSGTPTVFINGRLMPGAFPFESFRQVIDEERARLNLARGSLSVVQPK